MAGLEFEQLIGDSLSRPPVQATGRLIRQNQCRPGNKYHGQRSPLALATGNLIRITLAQLTNAQPLEPVASAGVVPASQARSQPDIIQQGQGRHQVGILKDHAESALPQFAPGPLQGLTRWRAIPGQRLSQHRQPTGTGRLQATKNIQ